MLGGEEHDGAHGAHLHHQAVCIGGEGEGQGGEEGNSEQKLIQES